MDLQAIWWVCAQIWRLLVILVNTVNSIERATMPRSTGIPPPEAFRGLRPQTASLYRTYVQRFSTFMVQQRWSCRYINEIDHGAVAYIRRYALSPGQATTLLAAVERAYPAAKWNLPYAHLLVKVLGEDRPPKHTVPEPWMAALALAQWMSLQGYPRLAGVHLLQWGCGLRPSEALGLRCHQIVLPEENPSHRQKLGYLVLGPKTGTKSGRPQFVLVDPGHSPITTTLMRRFRATTPSASLLTVVNDVPAYNRILRRGCAALGLPLFSGHGPRAGWATAERLAGRDFRDLQEAGRWENERSVRRYLDALAASDLRARIRHVSPMATYIAGDFPSRFAWWP